MPKLPSGPMPLAEVHRFLRQRRLTLRGLARQLQRSPSLISRVIRGRVVSEPIWREIRGYMKNPDDYPRRVAAEVSRARAVLKRRGLLS